jgi:putative sterol carrier protein
MGERRSATEGQFAEFAADPVLGDFAVPFPNLLGGNQEDLAAGFKRMAKLLGKWRRPALIQFTIGQGRGARQWALVLTPERCTVTEEAADRPDLEVLTSREVWSQVASGELPPLYAFGQGKMRVRGDLEIARLLARRLQGGKSADRKE